MASEDEDKARRLAEALLDELEGDLGSAFAEAAKAGTVAERFASELQTLRGTYRKRAPALPGRDPFGEVLRKLVGKHGDPGQIALEVAAAADASAKPVAPSEASAKPSEASAKPAASASARLAAAGNGAEHGEADGESIVVMHDDWESANPGLVMRLRAALREARRRVRRLEAENQALREELLSAGEMIETLALDLERPVTE